MDLDPKIHVQSTPALYPTFLSHTLKRVIVTPVVYPNSPKNIPLRL